MSTFEIEPKFYKISLVILGLMFTVACGQTENAVGSGDAENTRDDNQVNLGITYFYGTWTLDEEKMDKIFGVEDEVEDEGEKGLIDEIKFTLNENAVRFGKVEHSIEIIKLDESEIIMSYYPVTSDERIANKEKRVRLGKNDDGTVTYTSFDVDFMNGMIFKRKKVDLKGEK